MSGKPLLLFILLVLVCGIVTASIDDEFIITMDNSRSIYYIDYGTTNNTTLTTYSMESSVNLDGVNDWTLYGGNCGEYWEELDTQTGIAFVSGVAQDFPIGSPDEYRYYGFLFEDGFYDVGETITLTFTTDQVISNGTACVGGPSGSLGYIDSDQQLGLTPWVAGLAIIIALILVGYWRRKK